MKSCERRLAHYFLRNGYARSANEDMRRALGQDYKKGYEIRFVLETEQECDYVRELLYEADLKPGSPFKKSKQIILPVYGKAAQDRILSWANHVSAPRDSKRPRA